MSEEHEKEEKEVKEEDVVQKTEENMEVQMTEREKARNEIIEKENEDKTENISKKVAIAILIVIVTFVMLFLIFCMLNRFNKNVYMNVYLLKTNLSSMSSEEVSASISALADSVKEEKINIYQDEKLIYIVKPEDIDLTMDTIATEKAILDFGRGSNIILENFKILLSTLGKNAVIVPKYTYSQEKLDNVMKNILLSVENLVVDDSYSIDEKTYELVIVKGKTGNYLDISSLAPKIVELFGKNEDSIYKLELETVEPKAIVVDDVYNAVCREAKDAYEDKSVSPSNFIPEIVGLNFDKTALESELAKPENQEEGITIKFPLVTTIPKVKLADINYMLLKDKIDGLTTYFDPNQSGRVNNLEIALKYLNGVIIMPGEIFSYAKIIGDTTTEKGYKPAATFKAGTVVYEVGGGICQTSSTLYYVALKANMEIVERHAHGLPVGYIKPSLDATVYGEILDLKFKNTRKYPIKIVTSFSPTGNLNISIYGTRQEDEYDIELTSNYLYTIPYSVQYVYDDTLDQGTQIVLSNGVNGYASEAYITKSLNGKVITSYMLSRDVYSSQRRLIKVGTKVIGSSSVNQSTDVGIY